MPAAARITDFHSCPLPNHVGGPVNAGCATVIIGYQPAARVGDALVCAPGPDSIARGEPSVIIGNKPAARMGDPTAHGGTIAAGCPTVIIGSVEPVLRTNKPFCEDCGRSRKQAEVARARAKGR